ncbi:MAG: hypothetical protein RQ733_02635 [Methyloprofundus sp.]|nr:hypothetical protein [Methyloprofundus sp.]
MSKYRKRKQAVQRKNLIGLVLIFAVLALIAGLAFFRYELQNNQAVYDPETLCPIDVTSPKYVALVFDKSDTYNKIQQQFLRRFFSEFKAKLLPSTRISIYVIDAHNNKEISPDFVVCAPRTGDDANAFYENPKLIRQRWHERFEQPLDQAIDGFMQPAQADFSPIMEVFQTISLSAFPPHADAAQKQIILISDMLQHTSEWSHYRGQMNFSQLQKTVYYQRINTDLQQAEVNILYVRREGMEKLQNKRHAFFWSDFIQSIGGQVTLIEKIDG